MKKSVWLYVLCFFVLVPAALAQDVTGSIVGSVSDPSGAPVPGAKVSITNTDRNAVLRTATSSSEGNWAAPLLPVGHYSVSVEANGFKKSITNGLELNVNDNLTVKSKLEVGNVQENVTVAAEGVQVELQQPTAQNLIEGRQITELSLNARNYEQLVALMPGVTFTDTGDQVYVGTGNPLTGQSNAVRFAINGGRTDQNGWTVDGADNVDRGANLTLLSYPSVDSIAEFRVLRGEYSAEFGRNAGGMINVVTKSGTNSVHFGLYEFFRNDKLSANNYFSNQSPTFKNPDGTAKVAPLRYNNFGWNLAGPVYIPKIYNGKNKMFFFFSEEFRRSISYTPVSSVLPTANEKKGIFDAPVCTAFTGSTCTASATTVTIDPVAQAYLKDIFANVPDAAPAVAGGIPTHNVFLSFRNVYNFRQEALKMDYQLNDKWLISGRYSQDTIPTTEPRGLFQASSLPGVADTQTSSPGHLLTLRLTGTITPTMVNELGYNYSYGAVISDPTGLDNAAKSPDINVKMPFAAEVTRIPTMSFGGISSVIGFGPYRDYNRNHAFFDTFTKVMGKHTLKLGFQINKYQKHENPNGGGTNIGSFTFATTPRPTGSLANATMQGWANFLLGNVSNFTQQPRDFTSEIHQNQAEMFAQDDIRLRRNLTFNAGVRWSLFRQPTDAAGYLNTFDPSAWVASKAPSIDPVTGNLIPNTGDPLNGQILANKNSPYGSKITAEQYKNFAPRVGLVWDPFSDTKTAIRAGYGIAYDTPAPGLWEGPDTSNAISTGTTANYANTTFAAITSGTLPAAGQPPSVSGMTTHYQTPYVQQWSFDIQRGLPGKSLIDVGYFGAGGRHELGYPDLNQLPVGAAYALGITNNNPPLSSTTSVKLNPYRPFPGYKYVNIYETWFTSNYHSLQAQYKKEFARNGFIQANYTWAKTLTNSGSNAATPQDFYNRSLDKGWGPYDRKFVLTVDWNYELPFFLNSKDALLKHTLGGWQYSGIYSAASGLPFNATSTVSSRDPAGLGILGSQASARPDLICDPNTDAPHTQAQFFNTGCIADVPNSVIRPGNAPRNSIRGPGYGIFDMSLMKDFHFNEHTWLQFRAESYNTFNHTNFASIGASLGSSTFGTVTAARDARVVSLGLKLYY